MYHPYFPATLRVDLSAIRHNVRVIREATGNHVMGVVKAGGYGAGLLPAALAAVDGGAVFLGVGHLTEALELRREGVRTPILSWLHTPQSDYASAVADGIEIGISDLTALQSLVDAHKRTGAVAKAQVKIDTGVGRNGVHTDQLPEVLEQAARMRDAGMLEVTGAFAHIAPGREHSRDADVAQRDAFYSAVDVIEAAGFELKWRHMGSSRPVVSGAAAESSCNMVRPGLAMYGYSPIPEQASAADFGLRPAFRLTARLAASRTDAPAEDQQGVIPIGYADGVPSTGVNLPVRLEGRILHSEERVWLDQFVIGLGAEGARSGAEVVLFGDGADGDPTVEDWARAAGTNAYEIITRIGASIPRRYVGR